MTAIERVAYLLERLSNQAHNCVGHVAAANYPSRENDARRWIDDAFDDMRPIILRIVAELDEHLSEADAVIRVAHGEPGPTGVSRVDFDKWLAAAIERHTLRAQGMAAGTGETALAGSTEGESPASQRGDAP